MYTHQIKACTTGVIATLLYVYACNCIAYIIAYTHVHTACTTGVIDCICM